MVVKYDGMGMCWRMGTRAWVHLFLVYITDVFIYIHKSCYSREPVFKALRLRPFWDVKSDS